MRSPFLSAVAGALLLPAAAHATDVSGLWEVSTSIAQAPVRLDCSLLQVGVQLTGWCEPESAGAAPTALTGQLDRTRASWSYEVNVQGRPVRLAYRGTLTADSLGMTGTLSYGGDAAGLTAVRK